MGQKSRAIRGVIWSAMERFSVQGVQFIVSIILARILVPEDFGLIAIVLIFLQIFQTLNESGFSVALIYKQNRDDLDFSTAFVANIAIGIISYIILFLIAPLIADFYDVSNLVAIMRILSLNILINSFGLIPLTKFTIGVDFKSLAKASFCAAICSGLIGIFLAYKFRNAYALVFQSISYSTINVIGMYSLSKWKPCVAFSLHRFKVLFNYAYKLIGARIINVVFDDFYSLAIGKLYSPTVLGCYNRSMSFRQMLSKNIINIIQRVSTPILCEYQNDFIKLRQVLLSFIGSASLIVFPLLAGLMLLSVPLVNVVLGAKWAMVSELLIYGCPYGFFYLVSTFNRNIYTATGRTDVALNVEIFKKVIFIIIFLITMRFDVKVLLIGLDIIALIEMTTDIYLVKRLIGITYSSEIKTLLPILFSTLIMSVTIYPVLVFEITDLQKLLLGTLIGVVTYSTICYIFNVAEFKKHIQSHVQAHR